MANVNTVTNFVDRREDTRVDVQAHCQVATRGACWYAHLLNISHGGALVSIVDKHGISLRSPISLNVELPHETETSFNGVSVHVKENYVGIAFDPPISETARRELQAFVKAKQLA
ncbi:MAG: PilZ domain-containing protein [Cellvibrionaceae bacterium]|nr:PilZ domain-containing protein [Cellvibrionaceae bacterium]